MTHGPLPILQEVNLPSGKAYWRSLDQLADTPEFRDWVERKFPGRCASSSTAGSIGGGSST